MPGSKLPEASICVSFVHPSPWLTIDIQKGIVNDWIKSFSVLISPGPLSGPFPDNLLESAPFLFSIETAVLRVTDRLPHANLSLFLSLYSESLCKVLWLTPLKPFSICSQDPWHILSYYGCSLVAFFYFFLKWKLLWFGPWPSSLPSQVSLWRLSTVINYIPVRIVHNPPQPPLPTEL